MSAQPLWTVAGDGCGDGRRAAGRVAAIRAGPLDRQPQASGHGEAFFANHNDRRDGHEFVATALAAEAGLAVVAAERRTAMPGERAASGRARCAFSLACACRGFPRADKRQGDRRDRLGWQDQHQGSVAARARAGRRDPCVGRFLQQPLGRAAVARALSGERTLRGSGNGG